MCYSGSVVRVHDLRSRGPWIQDVQKALHCVLGQDTLSSVLYWFNPGNLKNH